MMLDVHDGALLLRTEGCGPQITLRREAKRVSVDRSIAVTRNRTKILLNWISHD